MAYFAWNGLAIGESGDDIVVLESPTVTVVDKDTGSNATIASDSSGTSKSNPFTAGTDGSIVFYAEPGLYKIRVEKEGNSTEWDNEAIGGFEHNELEGRQGGTSGEYYHLTSQQHSYVSHLGSNPLQENDYASTSEHEDGSSSSTVAHPAGVHAAFKQYGFGGAAVGDGGIGTIINDLNSPVFGDGVTAVYKTESSLGGNTANQPLDESAVVIHYGRGGRPSQQWLSYTANRKFTRHKSSGGWSNWFEDLTSNDLAANGGTVPEVDRSNSFAGTVESTSGTSFLTDRSGWVFASNPILHAKDSSGARRYEWKLLGSGSSGGRLRIRSVDSNDATETDLIHFSAAGGVEVGSPTGGDQGLGTLNAEELYENGNRVQTDYVFDAEIDGKIDYEHYDRLMGDKPVEVDDGPELDEDGNETGERKKRTEHHPQSHDPAKRFEFDDLDPATFAKKAHQRRKLPAMARVEDNLEEGKDRPSLGMTLQAIIETCEVQAEHIEKLRARIEELEDQAQGKPH